MTDEVEKIDEEIKELQKKKASIELERNKCDFADKGLVKFRKEFRPNTAEPTMEFENFFDKIYDLFKRNYPDKKIDDYYFKEIIEAEINERVEGIEEQQRMIVELKELNKSYGG
jgi:hypothetical protein